MNSRTIKWIASLMLLILVFSDTRAQTQSWNWVNGQGGTLSDKGRKVCTDAAGNVFVAGTFTSQSITIGTITINNSYTQYDDIYLAKYSPNGNVLWARKIGGTGSDIVTGLTTDNNGWVYITGTFNSSSVTVAPYTIVNNYLVSGSYVRQVLIGAFNSMGTPQWLKTFQSNYANYAGGCAFSNSQSALYVCGAFTGTTLSTGTGTYSSSNINPGYIDYFLSKISSTGSVLWTNVGGAGYATELMTDVAVDPITNDVYAGGYFSSTGDIASVGGTLLYAMNPGWTATDLFLSRFSSSGTFQWVKTFGAWDNYANEELNGIETDALGNCIVTGVFEGSQVVCQTYTVANLGTVSTAFLSKFNQSGSCQWLNKLASSSSTVVANGIGTDGNNNVYVAGAYNGSLAVIGTTTLNNSNAGTNNLYVAKFNSAGTNIWAATAQGTLTEIANDVASDLQGNVYVTGYVSDFTNNVFGTNTLVSVGNDDAFLAKINCLDVNVIGTSTLCQGTSATLTANGAGATSYSWSTGATTNSIIVSPLNSTTYTLYGFVGTCSASSQPFLINLTPASVNAGANLSISCGVNQTINATTNPSTPISVAWTPTTGLSNTSVINPQVIAAQQPVTYSVTATFTNGCQASSTVMVSPFVQTPNICMVTVDSAGNNNQVFWNKNDYPELDSMIILRETSTNTYKRIGAVSKNAISMFTDTVRSIGPANGDPKISTYRYKIQLRDTCGNYGQLSLWHNTVYFTHTGGTFFWNNNYTIEGNPTPINPVINYSLIVFPDPVLLPGTYSVVGATSGNQNSLVDPNYSSYATTADWRVEADLGYQCEGNLRLTQNNAMLVKAKKSRSNIQNNRTNSIKELNGFENLKVYPNPGNGIFYIEGLSSFNDVEVQISNLLGQNVVYGKKFSGTAVVMEVDVSNLKSGIYILTLTKGEAQSKIKLIKN